LIAASIASGLVPAEAAPAGKPAAMAKSGQLHGVFCTTAANCWAVGGADAKGALLNLVLHWTGKKWIKITVPSPGGTAPGERSELTAVRCTAARDCWAVGDSQGSRHVDRNQALHWNGKGWLVVPTPSPGAAFNALADVACTSGSSCWAVGVDGPVVPAIAVPGDAESDNGKFFELNEVLHWNGRKWAKVAVPSPAGTKPSQINELFGLSCTSSTNCWAAGSYGSFNSGGRFRNEVLRWNGRKWFKVSVINPDGTDPGANNALAGINCSSPTDCWAVGNSGGESAKPTINQALHWNGMHWSRVSTPNPGGMNSGDTNSLASVRCTAAANCLAVGVEETGNGPEFGQILHWTGRRWLADF
jgi:hypothetical protein